MAVACFGETQNGSGMMEINLLCAGTNDRRDSGRYPIVVRVDMTFAQLTYRDSLRDIEACLRSQKRLLYQMGFRSVLSRNTLANANEHRDWRIYADFAQLLINHSRRLYRNDKFYVDLKETV